MRDIQDEIKGVGFRLRRLNNRVGYGLGLLLRPAVLVVSLLTYAFHVSNKLTQCDTLATKHGQDLDVIKLQK